MRLVIWHGYLLDGTGSNVYTREVAKAWAALGHDVRVICAEPRPEEAAPAGVRAIRPDFGPLLPVFVVDDYEGVTARHVAVPGHVQANRRFDLAARGGEGAGERQDERHARRLGRVDRGHHGRCGKRCGTFQECASRC